MIEDKVLVVFGVLACVLLVLVALGMDDQRQKSAQKLDQGMWIPRVGMIGAEYELGQCAQIDSIIVGGRATMHRVKCPGED